MAMNEDSYNRWSQRPTPKNLATVVKDFSGILRSELPRYQGNLPTNILKSNGKKIMIDAVKTFDPRKGTLKNHIASNLRRLHRVNYETSSVFRMSEELQQGVNQFKMARDHLENKLQRDPTNEELSGELKWSPTKVARLDKQLKKETLSSALEMAPSYVQMEDPMIDFLYHDLEPRDKIVFQHRTGYRKAPILSVADVAKRIKVSPASVSNRALKIAKQLQTVMGER